MYNTVFDDEASTSIYDGTAPFAGSYQPDGSLSNFDGQSITGTWQLLITNGHSSTGTVEFTIMVETDSSTPDPYPDYGTHFASTSTTFIGNDLTFIELDISDGGTITDLNIQLNLDHAYQDGLRYLTVQLLSPYGNSVELAHGDQNGSNPYWGSQDGGSLYNTVDAVEGPALMFYPRMHTTSAGAVGNRVTFQIMAEEVENLTAVEFNVNFDTDKLSLVSVDQGNMLQISGESIFLTNYTVGSLNVISAALGGNQPSVDGTGVLMELTMEVINSNPGTTTLEFDGSAVFRDPDNNDIPINETVSGLVIVE